MKRLRLWLHWHVTDTWTVAESCPFYMAGVVSGQLRCRYLTAWSNRRGEIYWTVDRSVQGGMRGGLLHRFTLRFS